MPEIKVDSSSKSMSTSPLDVSCINKFKNPSSANQNIVIQGDFFDKEISVVYQSMTIYDAQPQLNNLVFANKQFDWSTSNPYQRINHLRDLEDNWDGYGAPKFSEPHIQRTIDIYLEISNYCEIKNLNIERLNLFVAPGSDGSVLLEFSSELFKSRELEVWIPSLPEKQLSFLKFDDNSQFEEEGEIADSEFIQLLEWLTNEQ